MRNPTVPFRGRVAVVVGIIAAIACSDRQVTTAVTPPAPDPAPVNAFHQSSLVADMPGWSPVVDTNLVEPWGIAFGQNGGLWVANNTGGTVTLYDPNGAIRSRVVRIPGGQPAGIVSSSALDFVIEGGAATWLFAGESGVISAWNSSSGDARVVVDNWAAGANYKGLAVASVANGSRLFATNFARNRVEMYDGSFNLVASFTDPGIPEGYSPFGIQNVNGRLFVTFAPHLTEADFDVGLGRGYVDIFTTDGVLVSRFASNGSLNAPWGIAVAPSGFGPFSNHILIASVGDGHISVFDQNGHFVDLLRDESKSPVAIGGLWGIGFGIGDASGSLYFVGCPNPGSLGLIGTFTPQ